MILANVTFGSLRGKPREELEDAVESYLTAMFKGGQICGERFLTWTKGKLNAHVLLPAPEALNLRSHTAWGKKDLTTVVALFGKEPVWKILDDDTGKTSSKWRGAPSLYVFTNAFDWYSPVCRGDGKRPIPLFSLPVTDQIKESLYHWQRSYRELDGVWLGSGAVEIPAYRQLADPNSELAEEGRRLCKEIEISTGISTFYFLMRYWGRARGEDERGCPGCGGTWRTSVEGTDNPFQEFHFRCEPCRLVSHLGPATGGGRHTRIGEYAAARTIH
jgi:predicted  nucleic acid-binding Zn ribbon protein